MSDRSVALVDHHPVLIEGIAELLKRCGGYTLVATGNVAADIVSITKIHQPDDMIVDINAGENVFQAISDALKLAPKTKMVVFTDSDSPDDAFKALDAGAKGYVLKGCPGENLFQALQTVQRGEVYVTPSIATKLFYALKGKPPQRQNVVCDRLNVQEEKIIRLLICGKTNNEIACELSLKIKTVKAYMTSLMGKLNVHNRLEALIAAQKLVDAAAVTYQRPDTSSVVKQLQ